MSVKNFKFVSPGVFINEIDNSFIPKQSETIGPVVIGRASRGLALTPVKVQSYSEYVQMFGDTVPGAAGGDVWRDGNNQSPMYGTYAAKAFLNANVAPLTYMRLLGDDDPQATGDGVAGWQTTKGLNANWVENGGAIGLWLFPSSSITQTLTSTKLWTSYNIGTGRLAAVFYQNTSASMWVTGATLGTGSGVNARPTPAPVGSDNTILRYGAVMMSDDNGVLEMYISGGANTGNETIKFTFDDSLESFARKRFNTNPALVSGKGAFYNSASHEGYWLGQTYEQELRDHKLIGTKVAAVMLPLVQQGSTTTGPGSMRQATQEAKTGWYIGQQISGLSGSFTPQAMQKLFRFHGRGHGEWLQRNCKVSITNIRRSYTSTSDYGTFSVVIRAIGDNDSAIQVMERFDNCTLDPTSVNFIARKIGDKYTQWDTTNRRLKTYGDYDNQSKFIRVEMREEVEAGATDATLLPFGYYGPPRFTGFTVTGSWQDSELSNAFVNAPTYYGGVRSVTASVLWGDDYQDGGTGISSGKVQGTGTTTGSFTFPSVRLRASASDGGVEPTKAYFGMSVSRTASSTRYDPSVPDFHTLLYGGYSGGGTEGTAGDGVDDFGYVFSMNDVQEDPTTKVYHWLSGSRAGLAYRGIAKSYTSLLDAGYDSFTAPFFGGYDGFDIKVPDPVYNKGIPGAGGTGSGTATNLNSYTYYTIKRAIDTVADPEALDMNLLTMPGLTHEGLTQHMIDTCEGRADAMAIIDLPDVYTPPAEAYKSTKLDRITTTPTNAATALRNRGIDSSYAATFYPWVQVRDEGTGRLIWAPPSVAMMGVLASSERSSAIWFAPAGFNRGGLSDGAAGIPVTAVSERLTSKQRDTLYDSRINPIASFPSSGIVVFGQKTLQQRQSALDRINVRRLVIYLKKQISVLSTRVLFEQNVQATWNRFTGLIEPLLANVKTQFGITDYRLILDETTTTPDLIDQNILYAKIMVKPARAIEYIAIDFVIMNTGASFDD